MLINASHRFSNSRVRNVSRSRLPKRATRSMTPGEAREAPRRAAFPAAASSLRPGVVKGDAGQTIVLRCREGGGSSALLCHPCQSSLRSKGQHTRGEEHPQHPRHDREPWGAHHS